MTAHLDENLLYRARHKPYAGVSSWKLSDDDCMAINLFWRRGERASILAKAFGVCKNTIYYSCLTGDADSYPTTPATNRARRTNALINKMGEDEAWKRYVTQEMVDTLDALNADVARPR